MFRKHGIRFFVRGAEFDLFNPAARLYLGMSAEIGEFQALNQNESSIHNRIKRAREGKPTCGKLPFGRAYDAATGWSVIPEKRRELEEAARRYLAGEPIPKIAQSLGHNRGNLLKLLLHRGGTVWLQEFHSDALNIHESVETEVPRLLPEETIKALHARAAAAKTYFRDQPHHRYLLGRMIFCAHCGTALGGTVLDTGERYYRHGRRDAAGRCPVRPRPTLHAGDIENAVLRALFSLFGNPSAVQRAVEEAIPNRDQIEEMQYRLRRVTEGLDEVSASRDRVVRFISRGTISEDQAEKELGELRAREEALKAELGSLHSTLGGMPTAEEVKALAEKASRAFGHRYSDAGLIARKNVANGDFAKMSWEEARRLVQMVFAGTTPTGERFGVRVELPPGQGHTGRRRRIWRFHIRGRLVDEWGTSPAAPFVPSDPKDSEFSGGRRQRELLEGLAGERGTKDSCH